MTFYIQTGEHGKITDAITYAHEGYTPVEMELPLPVGLIGGAYELRDGAILYRPEWDKDAELEKVREELTQTQLALAEIAGLLGGAE